MVYRLLKSGFMHPWEIPKFIKEELIRTLEVKRNARSGRKFGNILYERVPKIRYLLNSMFFFYSKKRC